MTSPTPQRVEVAIIGAGPAGLMAAEVLSSAGVAVHVFDAMPSAGRKLLLAGKGGLNLTHGEPLDAFIRRYGKRSDWLAPLLRQWGPQQLRDWAHGLGVQTFVGTSGRVFPADMKAAPLLRAWLHRLRHPAPPGAVPVSFHMRHRWLGWADAASAPAGVAPGAAPPATQPPPRGCAGAAEDAGANVPAAPPATPATQSRAGVGAHAPAVTAPPTLALHTLRFATPQGERCVQARAVLLALGGGSWARLGSDGAWVPLLTARGVPVAPLRPANCGFDVAQPGWRRQSAQPPGSQTPLGGPAAHVLSQQARLQQQGRADPSNAGVSAANAGGATADQSAANAAAASGFVSNEASADQTAASKAASAIARADEAVARSATAVQSAANAAAASGFVADKASADETAASKAAPSTAATANAVPSATPAGIATTDTATTDKAAANPPAPTGWTPYFAAHFAGQPFKTVAIAFTDSLGQHFARRGEFVATASGVEGSLIYAASAGLRDEIARSGSATLHLNLLPDWTPARIRAAVAHPRGSRSLSSHLKSRLGLDGIKAALLHEQLPPETLRNPDALAAAIAALPLTLAAPRPLDEAISTAGGVSPDALTADLMLRPPAAPETASPSPSPALIPPPPPGLFFAGEMLDWEAPTGGYLLTACLSSGVRAGQAVVDFLCWPKRSAHEQ